MSEKIYRQSGAYITRPSSSTIARIMGYENPEVTLARELKPYLEEIGFSSMFPNFKSVRIGSVHPFALFLYYQTVGQQASVANLFPSITISDSTENNGSLDTLGHERWDIQLTRQTWENFKYYRNNDLGIWISDENITNIDNAFATSGVEALPAVQLQYQEAHTLDFSIWTDNDKVTSFLFDVVKRFLKEKAIDLQEKYGYTITGNISGRRSGDINLDFGQILYGSYVSTSMNIPQSGIEVDVTYGLIDSVNVKKRPEYHTLGG